MKNRVFKHVILEDFIEDDTLIKESKKLMGATSDVLAKDIIKKYSTFEKLKQIKILLQIQKKDIGPTWSLVALMISLFVIILPIYDKLSLVFPYVDYAIRGILFVMVMGILITKIVPFNSEIVNRNRKMDYLIWLIDEEIERQKKKKLSAN